MSYATILDVMESLETDRPDGPKRRARTPAIEPNSSKERSGRDDPASVGKQTKTIG